MRKIRQPFSILLVLIAVFFFQALNSCKNYDLNEEVRQSDSLISLVNQASQTLIIENEYIRYRIDSMENKLALIASLDTNRMSDEFRNDVLQFKAILRNYKDFMITYEALNYDNQLYKNYCQELRKKLLDHVIKKEEFEQTYIRTKKELHDHLKKSKSLVKNLLGIENMYQRLNRKLAAFLINQNELGQ